MFFPVDVSLSNTLTYRVCFPVSQPCTLILLMEVMPQHQYSPQIAKKKQTAQTAAQDEFVISSQICLVSYEFQW